MVWASTNIGINSCIFRMECLILNKNQAHAIIASVQCSQSNVPCENSSTLAFPCRNCRTCSQVSIQARSDFPHVARVGTTSDYDRQDYFQILCCGRDIVVTILKLKCQKQKVHGDFGSTESLVRFLISAL